MTEVVKDGIATATITVSEPTSSNGITLASASTNDNPIRVGATNPIKVKVGVGQDFAATEMTITYPSSLVSFNKDASTLTETANVHDDGNGTLTLVDYGEDKNVDDANYILAFTVRDTAGTAEFEVTKAGLGTKDAAVRDDLTDVTDLGSVSIEIKNDLAKVTFTDSLFYSEQDTVEVGGTFTFYPERITGGYYDYETPTASMDGSQTVSVTATDDGGWKITNVTGNITINAADRTPKSYGAVTYTGTGANKVTGKTETATYGTDITFTIPADVAPGIKDGVKYEVAAKIGDTNYTFGAPITNQDGSRTYKIPGASVTNSVTITVTATTLEANKITVSLGGNASTDGTYTGGTAGSAIQIDKNNGSATLTVDKVSGLNKGYTYTVSASGGTLTDNKDGTYTITGLTADATITINKTINVEGVKNQVEQEGKQKAFLTLNGGKTMWLIQLPNHVENTTTAVYKYDGKQMYWSADHNNYVIVVISETAPSIEADKFTLETVNSTPTVASNDWDVNKSGTLDANDAQLIWNMYNTVYGEISDEANGATAEKFMLADANHDGVLDSKDARVIINKLLNLTT